jgi:hypothetical protein
MAGFIESFKKGLAGDGTQRFSVAGIVVKCAHCGGGHFDDRSALLNTPGMTLLGLDWANESATLLICTTCGHVSWFLAKAESL